MKKFTAYLWLATISLFLLLGSCQKEDDFTPQPVASEYNSSARDGYGVTPSFRTLIGFDVEELFVDIKEFITGKTGDDYVNECCLGTGNFDEPGKLLYLKNRVGDEKPTLLVADENLDQTGLTFVGIRAYNRGAGSSFYDMPFDLNAPSIPISVIIPDGGTAFSSSTFDIGSWGTQTLSFRRPSVTPSGYPEEHCAGLLVPFGHNELGNVTTCFYNGVEQFVFFNELKTFLLTTDNGSGNVRQFLVYQGLSNGMPSLFAARDYGQIGASAGDLILQGVMPGDAGGELVRLNVEYLSNGTTTTRYAFPTFRSTDIHNSQNGTGCLVHLEEVVGLAVPNPCDDDEVDCSNAENSICSADCLENLSIQDIPSVLSEITMARHGDETPNQTYRVVEQPNWGGGLIVFGKFSDCKSGSWLSTVTYTNSSGSMTSARQATVYSLTEGWGIGTQFKGTDVVRFDKFGPNSDPDRTRDLTFLIDGISFNASFDAWTGSDDLLELLPLENSRAVIVENGNALTPANNGEYPETDMGTLAILFDLIGESTFFDEANGIKRLDVIREDCFYRVLTGDCDRFSISTVPGKTFAFGLDLALTGYNIYQFDGSGNLEGTIISKDGFPASTIEVFSNRVNRTQFHTPMWNCDLFAGGRIECL